MGDITKVSDFPDRAELYGSILDEVTPLDRFFWLGGLGHLINGNLKLAIDPKKVYLNPEDAKVLYEIHRDFLVLHFGEHSAERAKEEAANQWLAYGPSVLEKLPRGIVAMESGYVTISQV